MARPREFDIDAALERAMQAFWAKGYESTSLDDLCEATGLGRSSLYAAFGDKRGLYLRALDRYEDGGGAHRRGARAAGSGAQGDRRVRQPADRRHRRRARPARLLHRQLRGGVRPRGPRPAPGCAEPRADRSGLPRRARRARRRRDRRVGRRGCARALSHAGIQGLRLVGKANPDRARSRHRGVMLRCLD